MRSDLNHSFIPGGAFTWGIDPERCKAEPAGRFVAVVAGSRLRYRPVTVSPFARINASRSPLLYVVIAAVLLTLMVGAGAAIATHHSDGDRTRSAPAAVSSVTNLPQAA